MKVKNIVQNLWANLFKEMLALTWYERFEHLIALILTPYHACGYVSPKRRDYPRFGIRISEPA